MTARRALSRSMSVLALAFGAAVLAPAAASAQAYPGGLTEERNPPGAVLGGGEERAPASSGQVAPTAQVAGVAQTRGETLPVTGGDIVGLTIMGAALVGGGTVLVRRTRRPALA